MASEFGSQVTTYWYYACWSHWLLLSLSRKKDKLIFLDSDAACGMILFPLYQIELKCVLVQSLTLNMNRTAELSIRICTSKVKHMSRWNFKWALELGQECGNGVAIRIKHESNFRYNFNTNCYKAVKNKWHILQPLTLLVTKLRAWQTWQTLIISPTWDLKHNLSIVVYIYFPLLIISRAHYSWGY